MNEDFSIQNPPFKIEIGYVDSLWEEYAQVDIADVVVDIDAPDLQSSYSYRVPEALQNTLRAGDAYISPLRAAKLWAMSSTGANSPPMIPCAAN